VTAQVKVTIADKLWEEDISKEEIEVICPCCAANFPACVYNRSSAYEIILEDFPRTRIGLDDLPKIDFDADIAFYSGQFEDEWDDNEPPPTLTILSWPHITRASLFFTNTAGMARAS
jgi:hypothetical protein